MMIGLDKTFKPEWIYKIFQITKFGDKWDNVLNSINDIIEFNGIKAKKKVITIFRRYYFEIEKKDKKEIFGKNYLHEVCQKYSFETVKPLLLFVLLTRCDISRFILEKILKFFSNSKMIDTKILKEQTKKIYGDRRIVEFVVTYYLTILSYFDILKKENQKYFWKNKKLNCTDYILKDMLLLFGKYNNLVELDITDISYNIEFILFDISNLENVVRDYNTKCWQLQKTLDHNKIIITEKI